MKAHMLKVYMAMIWNLILPKSTCAFNCGTNGVSEGGAWGLNQLEDYSKFMKGQCAYILTKHICDESKSLNSSRKSPTSTIIPLVHKTQP